MIVMISGLDVLVVRSFKFCVIEGVRLHTLIVCLNALLNSIVSRLSIRPDLPPCFQWDRLEAPEL